MVYGHYTKILNGKATQDKCPVCSAHNMEIVVLAKVHHIMFVPVNPSKKRTCLHCNVCNTYFNIDSQPKYLPEAQQLLENTKHKWYHYMGAMGMILFISSIFMLIYFGNKEDKANLNKTLSEVHPNDVIFYKEGNKKTSMQVTDVQGDSVWVHENFYSTNENPYKLDKETNYEKEKTLFLKSELKQWIDDGKIIRIQ